MADRRVTIRLSEDEFNALETAANKKGATIAAEIRAAITAGTTLADLTAAIAGIETRMAERIQRIPQASAAATVEAFAQKKAEEASRAQGGQA